jgi:hypothetical protein
MDYVDAFRLELIIEFQKYKSMVEKLDIGFVCEFQEYMSIVKEWVFEEAKNQSMKQSMCNLLNLKKNRRK